MVCVGACTREARSHTHRKTRKWRQGSRGTPKRSQALALRSIDASTHMSELRGSPHLEPAPLTFELDLENQGLKPVWGGSKQVQTLELRDRFQSLELVLGTLQWALLTISFNTKIHGTAGCGLGTLFHGVVPVRCGVAGDAAQGLVGALLVGVVWAGFATLCFFNSCCFV